MSAQRKNKFRRIARRLEDACTVAEHLETMDDENDPELRDWIECTFYLLDKYASKRDRE